LVCWPARATALDQIPESLLPLLARRGALCLSLIDIISVVLIFFGKVALSRLLFNSRRAILGVKHVEGGEA